MVKVLTGNFDTFIINCMKRGYSFNCNSTVTYVGHYHSSNKLYQCIGCQFIQSCEKEMRHISYS